MSVEPAEELEQPVTAPKPPKRKAVRRAPPNSLPDPIGEQADRALAEAQSADNQPPRGLSKRGRIEGSLTKGTSSRIQAILDDIADGLTQKQAAALHGISETTWMHWKNNSKRYPLLSAQAEARRIKVLLKRKRELADKKLDWKEPAWDLERNHNFKGQFADPAKIALQLNQHIHGNGDRLTWTQEELEDARKRLDGVKALQAKRREEKEREETRVRRPSPIIDIDSQVESEPLALVDQSAPKPAPEPEPPAPPPQGTSMRAGDTDPLSGQPIRQGDRPISGSLSERQRQRLEWERTRRGSEGKTPW